MESPIYKNGQWILYPSNKSRDRTYRFYVKVTAEGGSHAFFGAFTLHVGCTSQSTNFTDSINFITNQPVEVGSSPEDVYTFYPPTASLSYCAITSN